MISVGGGVIKPDSSVKVVEDLTLRTVHHPKTGIGSSNAASVTTINVNAFPH